MRLLNSLGFVSFFIAWYLFPDGRFFPRWAKWLTLAWIVLEIFWAFPTLPQLPVWIDIPLALGLVASCLLAQAVRYRRIATPADALLAFDSMIRLGRTSLAIFLRLDPPFAYQREARELERLLRREQKALVALREALRKGNARAFTRNAQKIGRAEERKRALFADLGVRGCLPRAPEGPPEPETRTV